MDVVGLPADVVFFDLSGTLVDTLQGVDRPILDSVCRNYLGYSYLEAKDLTPKDKMRSLRNYFTVLFGDEAEVAYAEYIGEFMKAIPQSRLFAGARLLLEDIRTTNIKSGLISNRPLSYAHAVLDFHGIADCFDVVVSPDNALTEKPDPKMIDFALRELGIENIDGKKVWLVGDTVVDVICADGANIQPVLFSDRRRNDALLESRNMNLSNDMLTLLFARDFGEVRQLLGLGKGITPPTHGQSRYGSLGD